jgi:thioredoxin-related protein
LIKILLVSLLLLLNLNADYKEGKEIFEQKCSTCHGQFISINTLKENFFEKNNELLNLKSPTVNMLAYAIMDSPKKIGDENDAEMQEIEIENYLKSYLENPDRFNSICDEHILQYYDTKESMKLSDDEYNNLAIFFMEYKNNLENTEVKNINTSSTINEEKILKKAKEENKQIIVYATAKSCYFCKKMDKEVLGLPDIKKQIDKNYIYIKNDMDESTLPFDLQKVYKKITPTFFIVSKEGKYIKQYPGSWTKSDFQEILKENLK